MPHGGHFNQRCFGAKSGNENLRGAAYIEQLTQLTEKSEGFWQMQCYEAIVQTAILGDPIENRNRVPYGFRTFLGSTPRTR